jgi:hypothetical protein
MSSSFAATLLPESATTLMITVSPSSHGVFCSRLLFVSTDTFVYLKEILFYFSKRKFCAL